VFSAQAGTKDIKDYKDYFQINNMGGVILPLYLTDHILEMNKTV
jgi:hypothetical protein